MTSFSRVHDKKLCIVAISALLSLPSEQIPASVSTGWPRLLQGTVEIFRGLPNAVESKS
jgi:importin-7